MYIPAWFTVYWPLYLTSNVIHRSMEITLHARMISPHFVCLGECDVLMLYNAEDEKFKEVIEKVGMAKKPLHVRQFRNSLLEWMKDPGITRCIFYHVFRYNEFNVYLCGIQIVDLRRYICYFHFIIHVCVFIP